MTKTNLFLFYKIILCNTTIKCGHLKNSTCGTGAGEENRSTIGSEDTKNGLFIEGPVPLTGLLTFAWKKNLHDQVQLKLK